MVNPALSLYLYSVFNIFQGFKHYSHTEWLDFEKYKALIFVNIVPKKLFKVASEIFLKNFYAMMPLFEHVCVQKCFMDYYHGNTKRFLQMPRPLCNFLHVYFLKIQVCNKTICVKKKKKTEEKKKFLLICY